LGDGESRVELSLEAKEAEELHAVLEELLESGQGDERVRRLYRLLGWRILASRTGGKGLTGRLAELARDAGSLEEYEEARERELGPVIEGLENEENRDP
jgi:hypothetical protein